MKIIDNIKEWKKIRKNITNKTIGFVPTMGNLHEGHLSLLKQSLFQNDVTTLSVFINPVQFNNEQDFASYPKTLEQDIKLAQDLGIDYLLLPKEQEIYPDNYNYRIVQHSNYSQIMEGKFRPGHFTGMLTIVMKLLLLTKPDKAYFGEKDFQQLNLVKQMALAFFLDTEIIECKTIRNMKGLPLSSRNNLLNKEELEKASLFSELLSSNQTPENIKNSLEKEGFEVDYIEEIDGRIFGAVKINNVRLIDNYKKEDVK